MTTDTKSAGYIRLFDDDYLPLLEALSSKDSFVRETRGTYSYEKPSPWMNSMRGPYVPVTLLKDRKLNYHFMVAEWMWISLGLSDLQSLFPFNSQMSKFSNEEGILDGAYGPRLKRDITKVRNKILTDQDTRQGVVCTWQPPLLNVHSKDIPCTLTLHFMAEAQVQNKNIRPKRALDLVVSMRSNDSWLGLPYDVFTFGMLHHQMAQEVNLEVGCYTHIANSEHLYQEHFQVVKELVEKSLKPVVPINPDSFSLLPIPRLPLFRTDPWIESCQKMFQSISKSGTDEDYLYDFCKDLNWLEAVPWVLFLFSRFNKIETTGTHFLDALMHEMNSRKK